MNKLFYIVGLFVTLLIGAAMTGSLMMLGISTRTSVIAGVITIGAIPFLMVFAYCIIDDFFLWLRTEMVCRQIDWANLNEASRVINNKKAP